MRNDHYENEKKKITIFTKKIKKERKDNSYPNYNSYNASLYCYAPIPILINHTRKIEDKMIICRRSATDLFIFVCMCFVCMRACIMSMKEFP